MRVLNFFIEFDYTFLEYNFAEGQRMERDLLEIRLEGGGERTTTMNRHRNLICNYAFRTLPSCQILKHNIYIFL